MSRLSQSSQEAFSYFTLLSRTGRALVEELEVFDGCIVGDVHLVYASCISSLSCNRFCVELHITDSDG